MDMNGPLADMLHGCAFLIPDIGFGKDLLENSDYLFACEYLCYSKLRCVTCNAVLMPLWADQVWP